MTRAFAQTIAKGLAAVLLCAQFLVVAYACPWLTRGGTGPSDAVAAASAGHLARPCHESAPATDPAPSNLCAEHCKYGQQSDRCTTVDVPPTMLSPLYVTVGAVAATPRPCLTAWLSALVAASPPHAVAHCVWRI